jgi:hypothetical protein
MAALSSRVSVTISVLDVLPSKQDFGTIMLAGYTDAFTTVSQTFTTQADMLTAGFTAGDPEYLAAGALLAANPNVGTFKYGRLGGLSDGVEQQVKLTPAAANTTIYYVAITPLSGTEVIASFTSDGTATVPEITLGVTTAFNLLGVNWTMTDNTTHVTITNDNTGEYAAIRAYTNDPNDNTAPLWTRDEETADNGLNADLTALAASDNNWYGLIVPQVQSGAGIAVVAAWAETNKKLYGYCTPDEDTLGSGGSDICATLKASSYNYTWGIHSREPGDYPDANWMSRMFTETPGAATWAYKTLNGVTVQAYTGTQITNLTGNYGNMYDTTAGVNVTWPGKCASGRYIDIQRLIDWLEAEVQTNIYAVLANNKKVPFTAKGIAMIEGAIREAFKQGVDNGGISDDSGDEFTITMPDLADVSTANKTARILTPVTAQATLAGAIHQVTMTITLSI